MLVWGTLLVDDTATTGGEVVREPWRKPSGLLAVNADRFEDVRTDGGGVVVGDACGEGRLEGNPPAVRGKRHGTAAAGGLGSVVVARIDQALLASRQIVGVEVAGVGRPESVSRVSVAAPADALLENEGVGRKRGDQSVAGSGGWARSWRRAAAGGTSEPRIAAAGARAVTARCPDRTRAGWAGSEAGS